MTITTKDAYGQTLVELGKEHSEIVVVDADLSEWTGSYHFARIFPERFFNIGIAEQNMVSAAAGLATCGKVPFINTFTIFASMRAIEQLRTDIAYPELNVKVVSTFAGIRAGTSGPTHETIEDLAITRSIPNLTVLAPADAVETKELCREAYNHHGPVFMRLIGGVAEDVNPSGRSFRIGKAQRLKEGSELTFIACGVMVAEALKAAKDLAKEGVSARVVNMASIKPLDIEEVLAAAKETGVIVTAEEHNIYGGLGGAVAETVSATYPVPVLKVGIPDTFCEIGLPPYLMSKYDLDASALRNKAFEALNMKGKMGRK